MCIRDRLSITNIFSMIKRTKNTRRITNAFNNTHITNYSKVARMVTLDELLAQSDVISLHCPLFPDTQGIINRESIAKMKDGVLLINTSRGPLILSLIHI